MPRDHELKMVRNIGIMAHIDAGKTTTTERILFYTGKNRKIGETHEGTATMDWMAQEQERGITITSAATTCYWKDYRLNIIDTPGHVDFTYEVSRALAACEGALLVVDATQGVEAQTLANVYMALDHDLEIVPVINKIDLPSARPDEVREEIEDVIGLDASEAPLISAKVGIGIDEVLESVVKLMPAPTGDENAPLQALIFDSFYDNYRGAICFVRIVSGTVRPGMTIRMMNTGAKFDVVEVGVRSPGYEPMEALRAGDVGYIAASIKDLHDTRVGDTITDDANPAAKILPGYRQVNPMVFCGIYPADGADYESLKDALEKLQLNDASLTYDPETSQALGFGFRCGFLGLLHMEIIQERLEREYDLDLITTAPTVVYEVETTSKEVIYVDSPSKLPPLNNIQELREPIAECHMLLPQEFLGNVITLCIEKRGVQTNMVYHGKQVALTYEIPMAEVVLDFFDRLKSTSRGYASLDYNFKRFQASNMVRVDVLINGERVDALALITHNDNAPYRGRELVEKMKELIPRQQFDIAIQAAIGNHIIARSTVKQLRKNVLAKCYGGDVSRKKKLLQKQKEGKKRMKQVGNVELPQEAFLAILHVGKDGK